MTPRRYFRLEFLPLSLMASPSREKARIPAWCDRVVWKGENLWPITYNTADLRFSDHRPVYGIFECRVTVEDEGRRADLSRELYGTRLTSSMKDESSSDSDHGGDEREYDKLVLDLPLPSSDRTKWWLNNGEISMQGEA